MCSYFIKTTMFYFIENTENTMWEKDRLELCYSKCLKQKRSTEGCSKFKSPETRQVKERLVSTLEHMQVPKWDRTRFKHPLLECCTRCICSMETLHRLTLSLCGWNVLSKLFCEKQQHGRSTTSKRHASLHNEWRGQMFGDNTRDTVSKCSIYTDRIK